MTDEYRQLGYDTSNDMLSHDSRRALGRYEEAALHIRDAGLGRLRMGQMMSDAGEFAHAAADWLSAAACFYLVPDLKRMNEAAELVRKLDREGKIPPERHDLHAALKEREEQLTALNQKLNQFVQDPRRRPGPALTQGQEALAYLIGQVRDLAGFPNLHIAIANLAMRLRAFTIAFQHQDWAEKFSPDNADIKALRVALLLTSGQREQGLQMGLELLEAHPEMRHLRVLLASKFAFHPGASETDWERAIELLQPSLKLNTGDVMDQLVPIALAAALCHGIGHEDEYRRLLNSFNRLADGTPSAPVGGAIATLRQALPQVFPQPGTNGVPPVPRPDHATLDRIFAPFVPLAGTAA